MVKDFRCSTCWDCCAMQRGCHVCLAPAHPEGAKHTAAFPTRDSRPVAGRWNSWATDLAYRARLADYRASTATPSTPTVAPLAASSSVARLMDEVGA